MQLIFIHLADTSIQRYYTWETVSGTRSIVTDF